MSRKGHTGREPLPPGMLATFLLFEILFLVRDMLRERLCVMHLSVVSGEVVEIVRFCRRQRRQK